MERDWNIHHALWQRASYKSPLEKRLRNHPLLKTPVYKDVHKDLHAELCPPPKPTPELICGMLLVLNELETVPRPQVDATLALSEFCLERDDRTAQRLGHHLLNQVGFLIEGYYDVNQQR